MYIYNSLWVYGLERWIRFQVVSQLRFAAQSWVALEGVSVYQKVDVDQGTLGNSNLFDKRYGIW